MIECPACHVEWPEDRFNGIHPECFKCRVANLSVSFGPAGKEFWHGTTTKEYAEKTVRQAKANGLDPVPVHSASVHASAAGIKKLETSAQKVAS